MKRTESEEEHNDVKDAVKGYIIPSWLTFSLSSMLTSAIQTQSHFRGLLTCQEQNQFKTLKVLNHASHSPKKHSNIFYPACGARVGYM